ncbi:MAG: large conductance mechanosensitive channel protein MscL [Chitinophagaceae bacterium]
MSFIKEFKEFALKGNVVDLAIAVIIGAAFSKIVNSFIDDIITPLLLKPALDAAHLNNLAQLTVFGTVKYGNFLSAVISFIIVAFILFLFIQGVNRAKRKTDAKVTPATPPELSTTDKLLVEIRDALKRQ